MWLKATSVTMGTKTVELMDVPSIVVFVLGSFFSLGFVSDSFSIMGFNPSSALLTLPGETAISVAMVLQLAALIAVFVTNQPELDLSTGIEAWLFIATLGLVVAPPFVPLLDALLGSAIAGMGAFVIQTFGISLVAYEPA